MPRTAFPTRAERAFMKELGNNARKGREWLGLTQEQVAREAGLSRTYVTELEHGKVNISILALRRLAIVIDLPLEVVFAD